MPLKHVQAIPYLPSAKPAPVPQWPQKTHRSEILGSITIWTNMLHLGMLHMKQSEMKPPYILIDLK